MIKKGQIYFDKKTGGLFQVRENPIKYKRVVTSCTCQYYSDARTVIDQCNIKVTRRRINKGVLIENPSNHPEILHYDGIGWRVRKEIT